MHNTDIGDDGISPSVFCFAKSTSFVRGRQGEAAIRRGSIPLEGTLHLSEEQISHGRQAIFHIAVRRYFTERNALDFTALKTPALRRHL